MANLPIRDSQAMRFAMYDLCCSLNADQIDYMRRIERGYRRVGICEPDGFGGYIPPMIMAAFHAMYTPRHITMVVTGRRALGQMWMHTFKDMLMKGRSSVRGALEVVVGKDGNTVVVNRAHKSYVKICNMLASSFVGFNALDASYSDSNALIIIDGFESISSEELDAVLAMGELPNVQIVLVARKTSEKPVQRPSDDVE